MTTTDQPANPISLLYPPQYQHSPPTSDLSTQYYTDLGFQTIVNALDLDGRHSRFVQQVLTELATEPAVIIYRQDILADLLRLPVLVTNLTALLPHLAELAYIGRGQLWDDSSPLVLVSRRLLELENYLLCVEGLTKALTQAGNGIKAAGFLALKTSLATLQASPDYQRLATELPLLRAQLNQTGSVTLGINLDSQFRPASATLLSVNPGRFMGKGSMLERLLGKTTDGASSLRGIAGLYKADPESAGAAAFQPEHQLFRELSQILERAVQPVLEALQQFSKLSSGGLARLESELAFYLGGVKLTVKLRTEGFALCCPLVAPATGVCNIKGVYCLDLVLRHQQPGKARLSEKPAPLPVVTNDIEFGPDATIFILTGPNSGGKTTFTRAVGQAQVLFQAGLLIPGERAEISPAAGIFSHFATAERLDIEGGRLAEELGRLAQVFRQASSASLILLNEPLTSTDHTSARVLSRDLLGGLKLLGARTLYVTHIQELISDTAALAEVAPDVKIVSLVAGVTDQANLGHTPTYHIRRGQPQTLGYASELARQYGLSLSQIAAMLEAKP